MITRHGKPAFVSNGGNGALSQLDLGTWRGTRTLEAGPAPEHIVLSPAEKTVYALNPQADTVSAVSVDSGKVVETYKIGAKLHGLDLGKDGRKQGCRQHTGRARSSRRLAAHACVVAGALSPEHHPRDRQGLWFQPQ